jgi:serine/threonine-protein phosphatase 2A activator
VEARQQEFMYMEAVAFIYKIKRGPFNEHSAMLYHISGIPSWHQIYDGLVKMYKKEVLSKFPVIQHFKFGKYLSMNKAASQRPSRPTPI